MQKPVKLHVSYTAAMVSMVETQASEVTGITFVLQGVKYALAPPQLHGSAQGSCPSMSKLHCCGTGLSCTSQGQI